MLQAASISQIHSAGYPEGLLRLDYTSACDGLRDNALVLPPRGTPDWLVAIHGFGGHANQLYLRQDIKKAWLPAYLQAGLGLLTPNLRDNAWMAPKAVSDLDDLLDFVRRTWGARRFFFSSGSLGATSNLIYASLRPQNVSGVIAHGAVTDLAAYHAYCEKSDNPFLLQIKNSLEAAYGGTPDAQSALYHAHSPFYHSAALHGTPVFLIHASHDELMPVAQSRRFAAAMADQPLFAYQEIPGGTHDTPLSLPEGSFSDASSPLGWMIHAQNPLKP